MLDYSNEVFVLERATRYAFHYNYADIINTYSFQFNARISGFFPEHALFAKGLKSISVLVFPSNNRARNYFKGLGDTTGSV